MMENIAGAPEEISSIPDFRSRKDGDLVYELLRISVHGVGYPALEPAQNSAWSARCLWCDRPITPRARWIGSEGFCCTGHRQQFWIAARRWTMKAIEAGLLSVDPQEIS
jgi:hypothetical protein